MSGNRGRDKESLALFGGLQKSAFDGSSGVGVVDDWRVRSRVEGTPAVKQSGKSSESISDDDNEEPLVLVQLTFDSVLEPLFEPDGGVRLAVSSASAPEIGMDSLGKIKGMLDG